MKVFIKLFLFALLISNVAKSEVIDGKYARVELVEPPVTVNAGDMCDLSLEMEIKPGYHSQSNQPLDKSLIATKVKLAKTELAELGDVIYPVAIEKEYPALGKLSVYEGKVKIKVPVKFRKDAPSGSAKLTLSLVYQVCNDQLCYPPDSARFNWAFEIKGGPTTAPGSTTSPTTQATSQINSIIKGVPQDPLAFVNTSSLHRSIQDRSALQAFSLAILAGLLFNIMPCVLPVLPLKVLGFYEASQHSRSRAFGLGVVFSLGVISTFAVLAVLILCLKQFQWGDFYAKPWFVWSIVTLIMIMGLSMVIGKSINLPSSVYNFNPRHDTITGNFFWGILTTVFATPCTAPLFPGMLLWAYSQPKVVGVMSMVMVGLGMSLPYLVLSAIPEVARKLPRAGASSEVFKQGLGCLMIVSAGFFGAGRMIQGSNFWWLVLVMVIIACVYLVVRTIQLIKSTRSIVISIVFAVAVMAFSTWWTVRISGVGLDSSSNQSLAEVSGNHERWLAYSDETFIREVNSGHPVLVKFTANWCATCQVIEGTVFSDQSIWDDLNSHKIAAIKVDLTDENAPGKNLLLKLNPAGGIPITAVWFGPNQSPVVLDSIYTQSELRSVINAN